MDEDEFGLPAFRYTCDQTRDPKAVTQVSKPGILSSTDHVHQVGNDRLTAIVSNYGHVQVRQDEGAPKFLNAYSPERNQFGGGFGYLSDGTETLSSFYTGGARSFDRIFGVGYFRKKVASGSYAIDQAIIAPFGDDPVLISQVTIANNGQSRANLRWIEYWGCQPISSLSALSSNRLAVAAPRWNCAASSAIASRINSQPGGPRRLAGEQAVHGRAPEEEQLFQTHEDGPGNPSQSVSGAD